MHSNRHFGVALFRYCSLQSLVASSIAGEALGKLVSGPQFGKRIEPISH